LLSVLGLRSLKIPQMHGLAGKFFDSPDQAFDAGVKGHGMSDFAD
jgi:hypothetical protein